MAITHKRGATARALIGGAVAVVVLLIGGVVTLVVLAVGAANTGTIATSHASGSAGGPAVTAATSARLPDYQPSNVVSKTSASTVLESSASVRTIGEFYAGALAQGGWHVVSSSIGSYHASFTAYRGDQGASISVYPRWGGSGISVSTYPRSLLAGVIITAACIGGAVLAGAVAAWAVLSRRRNRRASALHQPVPAATRTHQIAAH
jgi:uncharacterized integral membrane protein